MNGEESNKKLAINNKEILANHFSKDKNILIKRLIAIMSISIVTILIFWGIRANMDSTYIKNKFEQIYIQEYADQKSDTKSKFDVDLAGVQMKTEKDFVKNVNIDKAKNKN